MCYIIADYIRDLQSYSLTCTSDFRPRVQDGTEGHTDSCVALYMIKRN